MVALGWIGVPVATVGSGAGVVAPGTTAGVVAGTTAGEVTGETVTIGIVAVPGVVTG